MNYTAFITNFLIFMGAVIMAFNIKKFQEVMLILKNISQLQYSALRSLLLFHHLLIISFFIGYVIVLYSINSTEIIIGNLFVSVIFFSGAVFVLLGIILEKRMIASIEAKNQDTLAINKTLSINEKKLTQTNLSLKQEIEEHKITGTFLQRSYDTQTILNELLKKSLTDATILDVVNHCLDLVLSLQWLSFDSQGCIYFVESNPNVLVMKAHRGFSDELQKECNTIPFGKCLCGLAAIKKETVFASNIDDRHDILLPGTLDHGHYCIPILAKESTIGIINIYVKPGHERNDLEEDFLKAVANTMAIILMQHSGEEKNKEMEDRLNQSQKMEAIGTLAGGIAHDFNNILSGIFGYTQMAGMDLNDPVKIKKNLDQVAKGAQRAAELVQQILTISRQVDYKKSLLKLNLIVKEATEFIHSSIPTTIEIIEKISSRAIVLADPTQVYQVVMNLCTNAYHSMRETGGTLTVELSDVDIPPLDPLSGNIQKSGKYVKLEVRDTGHGMKKETLEKIFDPYFTTKQPDKGTGLGLAVVKGIVKKHNGFVKAFSELGHGSTVQVFLPRIEKGETTVIPEKQQPGLNTGTEKIMLVDDEENILDTTKSILKKYGYKITVFKEGQSAFHAFAKDPNYFDLVITDMAMPNMAGDELSAQLIKIRPDIPIVLCTGFSETISEEKALSMGIKGFLLKPIVMKDLAQKIREVLD